MSISPEDRANYEARLQRQLVDLYERSAAAGVKPEDLAAVRFRVEGGLANSGSRLSIRRHLKEDLLPALDVAGESQLLEEGRNILALLTEWMT